ncbi:hypothetical protein EIP91_006561 [Steccherinum ochraceum]|uniref:MYND-type domain-containing protein n=1 Tax=Steccherinum ochraceum TaxID=92696 RepID=A0A4R0R5H1_9APHY|nr:hypothetical protein EIP91_006561 [Steccherinum ochraceum]
MPHPQRSRVTPETIPRLFPTPGPDRHKVVLAFDSPRRHWKPPNGCNSCFKPKQRGASLYQCKGCQMNVYCSEECQKAEWPDHKAVCQQAQLLHDERPESATHFKGLLIHFALLQDVLAKYGPYALNLHNNPSARKNFVMKLDVMPLPGTREGCGGSYVVVDARCAPVNSYTEETRQMVQSDLVDLEQLFIRKNEDRDGIFFISIMHPDCSFVKAVRYSTRLPCDVEVAWKEKMIEELNAVYGIRIMGYAAD